MSKATFSTGETELFDIDTNRKGKECHMVDMVGIVIMVVGSVCLIISFESLWRLSKNPEFLRAGMVTGFVLAAASTLVGGMAFLIEESNDWTMWSLAGGTAFLATLMGLQFLAVKKTTQRRS